MLLVDHVETGRTFKIGIDHHDLLLVVFLAGLVENGRDGFSELYSTSTFLFSASSEQLGIDRRLDGSENVGAFRVSRVQVGNCRLTGDQQRLGVGHHFYLHLDGIVGVGRTLDAFDTRSHLSVGDDSCWALGADCLCDCGVQLVQVFTVGLEHLETVSFESLGDRISLEVV